MVVFLYALCARQKCDQADVYLSCVSVRFFFLSGSVPCSPGLGAELNLAVFVGQQQCEKSRLGTQNNISADPDASVTSESKVSENLRGWGDKGEIMVSRRYLNEEQIILCLLNTMRRCF